MYAAQCGPAPHLTACRLVASTPTLTRNEGFMVKLIDEAASGRGEQS
jgi:hypothetical protein